MSYPTERGVSIDLTRPFTRNLHCVEIAENGHGIGGAMLDDVDVTSAIRGATVVVEAGRRTQVTLDLCVHVRMASGEAEVAIPSATHDLLVRLGWTPPA